MLQVDYDMYLVYIMCNDNICNCFFTITFRLECATGELCHYALRPNKVRDASRTAQEMQTMLYEFTMAYDL